jgi:adenine phosphoribosyltransferase
MKIKVSDYIRTVPDYPVEGVNFWDMNSLFASEIWGSVVEQLAKDMDWGSVFGHVTHIVGIESRGFVVGQALASEMLKPMVMVRKAGAKYPGELLTESYDLVATGGSMLATKRLVEQTGATVVGAATVINLKYLNSMELERFKIYSAEEILS